MRIRTVALLIVGILAAAAFPAFGPAVTNPGHGAEQIGPGTFAGGVRWLG